LQFSLPTCPHAKHKYSLQASISTPSLRLSQFHDGKKTMTAAYHKEILIGLNEDSVRARKLRIKSTMPMKTTSRVHVVTNSTVEKTVADKRYEDFHGSTRNDMLSLVTLPSYDLMWNLTLKDKIGVYNHGEGTRRISTAEATYMFT